MTYSKIINMRKKIFWRNIKGEIIFISFKKIDKNNFPKFYRASKKFINITLQNLNTRVRYRS